MIAIFFEVPPSILRRDPREERGYLGDGAGRACRELDTPKYGETLKVVYIKYQPILEKSYQRLASVING